MPKPIERGIKIGRLENATAMLAEGFDIKVVSRVVKIPPKRLKKELQIQ